jgi:hypothetical protein
VFKALSAATATLFKSIGIWTDSVARRLASNNEAIAKDREHEGKLRRSRRTREEKRAEELRDIEHRQTVEVALVRGRPVQNENAIKIRLRHSLQEAVDLARGSARQLTAHTQIIETGDTAEFERLRTAGLARTLDEIISTQERLEKLVIGAGYRLEGDADNDKPRGVDDDWLRRFFKYAADVTDEQVMDVLEQALADSAVDERPLASPRALDTLRFFQRRTVNMFRYLSRHIIVFGAVPAAYFDRDPEGKTLDLALMMEMGLCKFERNRSFRFSVGMLTFNFTFKPGERAEHDLIRLTHVGKEIAGLMDPDTRVLQDISAGYVPNEETWRLQQKFGLSQQTTRNLTLSLIMDVCDQSGLRVEVYRAKNGTNHSVQERHRESAREPFGLDVAASLDGLEDLNQKLVQGLVDEFKNFDEVELPVLNDQSS